MRVSSPATSRRKVFLLAIVLAAVSAIAWAWLRAPGGSYYAFVAFEVDQGVNTLLKVQIMQRGAASLTECEANARTLSAALGTCALCRIVENRCLDRLEEDQGRLFTSKALPFPVSQTANGVIAYIATDTRVSRKACEQSEVQAASQGYSGMVKCYQAGVERATSRHPSSTSVVATDILRWAGQAVAVLIGGFSLMLLIRCASVAHPAERATRPQATDPAIKVSNVLKRFIDILLAASALLVLFPLLALVALLLLLFEGAPVFYISRRFISTTRCVAVLKFRTMVRDAASPKYALKERFMRGGYLDIPPQCEVYTRLGRVLERTQLVEVLQFLNILLDGMSLIGNRPLPADNIELLKRFDGWQRRFDCPAGITGIAQVVGKHNLTPERRLELESLYGSVYKSPEGNILWCDFLIVLFTIRLLLLGKNLPFDAAKRLLLQAHAEPVEVADISPAASGSSN